MARFSTRRLYRGPLRAVIFDWAGTVVDFGSRAPVQAVMRVFRRFQTPVTTAEARGPMGMNKRDHLRALLALPRIADRWRLVHGDDPAAETTLDKLYQAFLAAQKELLLECGDLIPGCLETVRHCRERGLRLGSSTGYVAELMELLVPAARQAGLEFDAVVCGDEVPRGRPAPWLGLENARRLDVYPMEAVVAVDDTTVGVEAGLNAGMWAIGVARSGNLVGLSEQEFSALEAHDRQSRVQSASNQLYGAGAHFVIDTVADLPAVLDQIETLLRQGIAP